jgi:hypothetical protein
MDNEIHLSVDFILQLKSEILKSRYIVAKIANAESLKLYFTIGRTIDKHAREENWGSKVLDAISDRLQQELPGLRGFLASNLKKMRMFYNEWYSSELFASLPTNQLHQLPLSSIDSSATSQLKLLDDTNF